MLPSLVAALLLPPALGAAGVPLTRATRAMVEVARGEETYRHEKGISPDDAGAVHAYLRRLGESRAEIVRVPGRPGTFLASDFGGGSGEKLERRLILLQSARGEVRELSRTSGAGDAWRLQPVVFVGGGRTFVLAELGAEYSRGLRVYELVGTTLRELGSIDAGVPGELGEEDPTPFARVRLERGRLVVRFDADLVLGTGREDAPIAKKPVVFRQGAAGFVRLKGPTRDRRSP
jgi:hypothetical protein